MKKIYLLALFILLLCIGCTKNVKDYDLTVSFQDQSITGKYTGQLIDDVAVSDSAVFVYKNGDDYLNYNGGFKNGQFSGKGHLETNLYTVHFTDLDRTGEYKGDVVDGIPKGNGEFTATTDDGETYTYTGNWDNGIFDGYGKKVFKDSDSVYEGTYTNGEYMPTKLEYLGLFSKNNSEDKSQVLFTMTDKAKNFISNNDGIFPTTDFEKIKNRVDTSIEFKHLMKNIDSYGDKLIKYDNDTGVFVNEYSDLGFDITILQVPNVFDNVFYYVYYFGKLNDIYNGDKVVVYGLPIATTSFTNVSNTTTQAVVLLGSYVTKR